MRGGWSNVYLYYTLLIINIEESYYSLLNWPGMHNSVFSHFQKSSEFTRENLLVHQCHLMHVKISYVITELINILFSIYNTTKMTKLYMCI